MHARRSPVRFALLVSIVLASIGLTIAAPAQAAAPDAVGFNLDGCDLTQSGANPASYDPDAGDLVCDDPSYVGGNLGKGWEELDLVPFRFTATARNNAPATQSYTIAVVVDREDAGKPGYDVLSAPVLNTAKSDASCTAASVGSEVVLSPGLGGVDKSLYRLVTITQAQGTSCVYDYYARLAVGSHLFPGASLHANLANENLGTAGIGSEDRSIPVNEIAPQAIAKDMSATRDADHMWDITKTPTPAEVSFGDTCDPQADRDAPVSITVEWERLAASPNGDVNILTHVYATNPADRIITINVSDQVYEGTTQTTPVGAAASSGDVDVPKNTSNFEVLTHQFSSASNATHFNDVATATYKDKITGVAIPGQTTAVAGADVQTGTTTNTKATVTDVEDISGTGFSFSADDFSPLVGTFDDLYVAGTETTGPVGWTSSEQSGDGSVTFDKTVYVDAATISSGELTDTATVTGSDGFVTTADGKVTLAADANVSLKIEKEIPDVLTGTESQSFTFHVKDSNGDEVAEETLTFGAGDTKKSVTVDSLDPDEYTVSEDTEDGWTPQDDQKVDLELPTCSGTASFVNAFAPAQAAAVKITNPVGGEDGWEMILTGPGTPAGGEKVVTDATGNAPFVTALADGGAYTITETAQTGWDKTGESGDCSFTVDFPADAGRTFTCTITNTQRGKIIVKKETTPDGAAQSFAFASSYDSDGFSLTDGQSNDSGFLTPGSYSVSETVPAGWDLTSATCDDGSPVTAIAVAAGETVTCTFNNRQRGAAKVVKTVTGSIPTGASAFTFQLRQGASAVLNGTVLETLVANAVNGGVLNFTTQLVPGSTYQICEVVMPGWSSTLGTFVPGSFLPPDGVALNPNVDNSTVCGNFTVAAGETKTFTIDNSPPPGGRALTIGFWKNWSSCSGGKQKPVLNETLASFPIASGQSTRGVFIGSLYVDTCAEAVALLNKSTIDTGKKMASDPAYNMAAQLMATELNFQAGAGKCGAAITAEQQAQALLSKYNFDGKGSYTSGAKKFSAADVTLANQLATTLDRYNNNLLC